jgi:hypothetical protein
MVERQEIDALLVGALYGELTPAEEAQLTAHLESHPGDRTALDDLKSARSAIRAKVQESRIFELQVDPPQAISALLVQEAARRAPRRSEERSEGWFARFVRSFVAHPAMAAAATLVLVVGVAGTIYLKNGKDQFADQTVASRDQPPQAVAPTPQGATIAQQAPTPADERALDTGGATGAAVGGSDNTYSVDLAKESTGAKGRAASDKVQLQNVLSAEKQVAKPTVAAIPLARPDTKPEPKHEAKKQDFVPVAPAKQASPRELDDGDVATAQTPSNEPAANEGKAGFVGNRGAGPGAAGGGAAPSRTTPSAQPAAPPPPPAMAPSPKTVKAAPEDALLAWAKDQHARVLSLVKANNCRDAAPLAIDIKNRAPDYFATNMANDRALSKCMAYVNDAAEKDAEKNAKSRASKRAAPSLDSMH